MDQDELYYEDPGEPSGFGTAVVLIVALVLLTIAFVWFVMRLDPLTRDFIESNGPAVTATEEPGET